MRVVLKALVGLALGAGVMVSTPFAAGDMFMQDLIEVRVEMGNFYFKPKHIELETGQYYKLVLLNASRIKHEFDSPGLVSRVASHKVEVRDRRGKVAAEIFGTPGQIQQGAKATVEWYFVPVSTGENIDIICDLPGHREAGMVATVTIK